MKLTKKKKKKKKNRKKVQENSFPKIGNFRLSPKGLKMRFKWDLLCFFQRLKATNIVSTPTSASIFYLHPLWNLCWLQLQKLLRPPLGLLKFLKHVLLTPPQPYLGYWVSFVQNTTVTTFIAQQFFIEFTSKPCLPNLENWLSLYQFFTQLLTHQYTFCDRNRASNFAQIWCLYNNLLTIHTIFEFFLLRLWWKPTWGAITDNCNNSYL